MAISGVRPVEYLNDKHRFKIVKKPVKRIAPGHPWAERLPGQGQDGYGRKIATDYMAIVEPNNVAYRVYATCFSNCASHWIKIGSQKFHFLDGDFHGVK